MVHQCAIFFPSEGGVRKREIAKSNGTFPTNIEEGGSGEALSIAVHVHFDCQPLSALNQAAF